ncbi:DivIVA domain-containing protein [Lentzea rhizosphaerae]|uniref:Cell wall synthesis protein Wag31 n=1 Tax=Lentzea rhizosphaerae TaxID=2041025 RepID=A0ABV8C608_9PSEU
MQTRGDLLPLRTGFDVVWRGYDREQVDQHVDAVENDLRILTADRNAAVTRADALAQQLQAARSEITELRGRIDRISRTPVDTEGLTERLRRMVELAHDEAEEITQRARAVADRSWSSADETTRRLRRRAEHLVGQLEQRHAEAEAEHRALMDRAHAEVEAMTRQAERRRRELDEQAAQARRRVQDDFEQAVALRRAEAARALAEQERAARARAESCVREAAEHARRIVADAEERVEVLRRVRSRIAAQLRAVDRLLSDTAPLLSEPEDEPRLAELIPVQERALAG